MIKEITLVHKKPGISIEEFNRHWKEIHGPLFARSAPAGLIRYVQNHLVQIPGVEYEGDGLVETWFDSLENQQRYGAWSQLKNIEASDAKALEDDAVKFLDTSIGSAYTWLVEEHVIREGESGKE